MAYSIAQTDRGFVAESSTVSCRMRLELLHTMLTSCCQEEEKEKEEVEMTSLLPETLLSL
jgi:hypothetical protein